MSSGPRPEILALIPARGGSKGIPRKNLLPVAGKPLIAYSIAHAHASRHITRTIVSTDDAEIAETARAYGAEVPFVRPAELAQDFSTDFEVFEHALAWLQAQENYRPELVVHLRPPGPVRKVELIDAAIEAMLAHPEADALRSVSTALQTPYKMWQIHDGQLQPLLTLPGIAEPYCQPRQKLPTVYWQNGYVDIVRPRTVLELGLMCGHIILPFVVNEPMFEIDYPENVPVVEQALRRLEQGQPLADTPSDQRHAV